MPFPRTWSEELIAEWLQIKGYFIETGISTHSLKGGSRNEVDIVGVKTVGGRAEILHIEVGSLVNSCKKNAETVKQKFSKVNVDGVIDYCRNKLSLPPDHELTHRKAYICSYVSARTMKEIENQKLKKDFPEDIEVIDLHSFIPDEILPTIQNWKKTPLHTLPQNLWLLELVDFMGQNFHSIGRC